MEYKICCLCNHEAENVTLLGLDGMLRPGTAADLRYGDIIYCSDEGACWQRRQQAEEETAPQGEAMKVSVLHAWAGAIIALVTGILLGMFAEKLMVAGFPEIALGIICICSFSVLAAAWLQGREG